MIMKCPTDGVLLQESRKGGLPHWTCATCRGRLIFLKTFRHALAASGAPDIADELRDGAAWPERVCPNCRHEMKKITLQQKTGKPLTFASCDACHWLWFDPGEDFDAWGAERERLHRQFMTLEAADRRFRYWHTFRGWGRYGFLIPWGIWFLIAALLIKNQIELRDFVASGRPGSLTQNTPFSKALFLISALALTMTAKTRQWFIIALALIVLALL